MEWMRELKLGDPITLLGETMVVCREMTYWGGDWFVLLKREHQRVPARLMFDGLDVYIKMSMKKPYVHLPGMGKIDSACGCVSCP